MFLKNYGRRSVILHSKASKQSHPKRRENQKAQWVPEEALQTAVRRREVESEGEGGRRTPLCAELQRAAQRGEKAFFSEHCKKLEGSNKSRKPETPQEKGKGDIWPRVAQ